MDARKAEVRARLEATAAGKKAKKGFMTPERKKKLRVSWNWNGREANVTVVQLLLRKKATEELKKEQELKAAERRKVTNSLK